MKLQIPRLARRGGSNVKRSFKIQRPIQITQRSLWSLDAWNFSGAWMLVLGTF
jgi:hypothetical protein